MSIKNILYFPNIKLRNIANPVYCFDKTIDTIITDMFDTMYINNGIGLAAPQIGINLRIVVIDISNNQNEQFVFINPKIVFHDGNCMSKEGCLSVPGIYDYIPRYKYLTIQATNNIGDIFKISAIGLLSRCIQHEIDHLNGRLFIDLLSPLKRHFIKKKLEKIKYVK